MDGGTVWNVNIDSAIQQCLKKVDSLDKITIDLFHAGYSGLGIETENSEKATENFQRNRDIHGYYKSTSEVASHMKAYPTVNWRYYIQEKNALGGAKQIDFRN